MINNRHHYNHYIFLFAGMCSSVAQIPLWVKGGKNFWKLLNIFRNKKCNAYCSLASSGSCSAECVRIGCASFRVKRRWRNPEEARLGGRVSRDITTPHSGAAWPECRPSLVATRRWLFGFLCFRDIYIERCVCLDISICLFVCLFKHRDTHTPLVCMNLCVCVCASVRLRVRLRVWVWVWVCEC